MKVLILAFTILMTLVTNMTAALGPALQRQEATPTATVVLEVTQIDEAELAPPAGTGELPLQTTESAALIGQEMMLVGLDAAVPLFDTPENRIVLMHAPVGTMVRVVNAVEFDGALWLMVESDDGAIHGWAGRDIVTQP